jgi:hypothetical protein
MQHDEKQLHQIAQDWPYHVFTVEEIAVLCNVSRDVVSKVRAAKDSPFCLNKCRPEWFTKWMRQHPDFQLTKGSLLTSDALPVSVPENPRKTVRLRKLSPRPRAVKKR